MLRTKELSRVTMLYLVPLCLLLIAAPMVAAEPTFTTIDVPGAIFTQAEGINPAGEITGFYCDDSTCHGFPAEQESMRRIASYP